MTGELLILIFVAGLVLGALKVLLDAINNA
jgi:hypothetical protein